MLLHCGILLLFLNCARTTDHIYGDVAASDFKRFSLWPSVHNAAANLLRIRRAVPLTNPSLGEPGPNEGSHVAAGGSSKPPADPETPPKASEPTTAPAVDHKSNQVTNPAPKKTEPLSQTHQETTTTPSVSENKMNITTAAPLLTSNATSNVMTSSTGVQETSELNKPGVVKRGIIVFAGFASMAVAYFIFYKRKNKNNEPGNSLGMSDNNQFRYGVLQNEDAKDARESSRVPLTADSEDELDDDLEIFDIVQKKKSLSYVNLQQNDEDIVLSTREDVEGDSLLLDIEDQSQMEDPGTLINWSSNGSKSIL